VVGVEDGGCVVVVGGGDGDGFGVGFGVGFPGSGEAGVEDADGELAGCETGDVFGAAAV
jgi:hypothetical protein